LKEDKKLDARKKSGIVLEKRSAEKSYSSSELNDELEKLVKTFQEELDKAQELSDEEFVEVFADELGVIEDEDLCECCGERRRDKSRGKNYPYCSVCRENMKYYPLNFSGIITAVVFIAVSFLFNVLNSGFTETLALNSAIAVIGILPTLFFSKSISNVICESGVFSLLFIKLLDCERLISLSRNKSKGSVSGAIIVGFIAGFFTLAFTRSEILTFIILLTITSVFMCRPETAVLTISLLFVLPSNGFVMYFICVAIFSYFVKVLRGKRSFYFHFYDLSPILFLILCLLQNEDDSFSVIAVIVPLIYFLYSGVVGNEETSRKCIKNIAISSTVYALYTILNWFISDKFTSFFNLWNDFREKKYIIENSESVSMIYGCAIVIIIALILNGDIKKRIAFLGVIINIVALMFCGAEVVLFACCISIIVLSFAIHKNKIVVLFVSSAVLFACFKFFSAMENIYSSIENSVSLLAEYKTYIWYGVKDSNSLYGSEGISNAGNLWIQLLFWGAIVALICVIAAAVVFVRNGLSVVRTNTKVSLKFTSVAIACVSIVYIISSFGCFSWEDLRVFLLFWIIGGLSSSSRRYYKIENETYEFLQT
jgi:hypothetical protein